MAFTLLVCADIGGQKLNLEIPFKEKPQLPHFHATVEAVFEHENQKARRSPSRGGGHTGDNNMSTGRTFALGRVQVYNDELRQWVDLVSGTQLHPYDQLYVYQRHVDGNADNSGRELPPPVSSTYFNTNSNGNNTAPSQSPSNTYRTGGAKRSTTAVIDAADLGETVRTFHTNDNNGNSSSTLQMISAPAEAFHMSTEEKMRLIFQDADTEENGYLTLADFRELFNRTHILFNRATIDEVFRFQSSNPSYLNYNEFTNFCRQYPVTFGALFTRIVDRKKAGKLERELEDASEHMKGLRRRREQLQAELEQVSTQLLQSEQFNRQVTTELQDQLKHRSNVEEEEQVVLDKEVRVAYQREILRREEADFVATAKRFDMHVDHLGQPNSGNVTHHSPAYRQ